MNERYIFLAALLVLALLLAWWFLRDTDTFAPKRLLTKNEEEFFQRLRRALPDFYIFPQVAFRAIVRPTAKYDSKAYTRQLAKIGSKHCDFLICDGQLNVLAIIELDDRSHISERDAVRDALTGCAGYTTVRYESRIRPSIAEIKDDFAHLLAPKP